MIAGLGSVPQSRRIAGDVSEVRRSVGQRLITFVGRVHQRAG
jgi:hypothetical protein